MSTQQAKMVLDCVLTANIVLCALSLAFAIRRRGLSKIPFFASALAMIILCTGADVVVMFHRAAFGISRATACQVYLYGEWAGQFVMCILVLFSIYEVFQDLMAPMAGLRRIGTLAFRWVGGLSLCLTALVVFGPHPIGTNMYATLVSQFEEGVQILTLALLLAVSLATRPLGLSVRSHSFGALLGFGMIGATSFLQAPWMSTTASQVPYSPVHLIGAIGGLVAVTTWVVYYSRPEPARRIITLPTTSPFFFWNRIAEALGDAPGEVAIGGIGPSMFAPAELLAFSAIPRQPAPVVEMPKIAQR